MTPQEQFEILKRGTSQIVSEKELLEKLSSGRPLRAKLGVDPTSPDLHLGHTVQLEKLRQFEELGHQVVLIIGDFTATIGDPSGRSATRPQLTREEVLHNAGTYTEQAFKILDRERTEVVYNGDWFREMKFEDVIRLNSRVTMQQMLQREDFKNRIAKGQEVRLHEIQYPIVQGWDSVEVKADVELGGTDQLFNILVGRDMQKSEGMPQQVAMLLPLLEGTDGVKKMSKSYDNFVGITDAPAEMFGKLMSISDELMARYYTLLLGENLNPELHPMESKKALGEKIVSRYHSADDAAVAREEWETHFSKRDLEGAALPEVDFAGQEGIIAAVSHAYSSAFDQTRSNGDIRRLITQGSIQLNGEKITDPKATPEFGSGGVLKLDKKRSVRIQ